jgi:putative transposase
MVTNNSRDAALRLSLVVGVMSCSVGCGVTDRYINRPVVDRGQYSVQAMCRVLGVAVSGYYEWLQQPLSNRAQEDARLLRLIRASFTASQGIYGAPRVFLDLREAGETCSKHRVARLMRQNDLHALHGYRTRRWSVGKPSVLIPNLLKRQFTVTRPNKAWVTDITYIRTWQGWLYLAVVMDLFSSMIVGWSAGPTMHRELVLDAVLMAVKRRRPRRTMIHSDQGTQYGSDAWRRCCRSNRLEPSMSRKGNCWDNTVAESFFRSLKKERIKKHIYKNRELARADLADYINGFYNRTRRHSHLGGVSPRQFEAAHK